MTSKELQIVKSSQHPDEGDDFKRIRGVGPVIEEQLWNAGIRTYAQLAAKSSIELGQLLSEIVGLSAERISKQDWVGQAHAMTAERETPPDSDDLVPRQHYASFTVRLSLNEDDEVRYTEVQHVQSAGKDSWAGWNEAALSHFFIERAHIHDLSHRSIPTPADKLTESPEKPKDTSSSQAALAHEGDVIEAPLQLGIKDIALAEITPTKTGKHALRKRLCAHITFELHGKSVREIVEKEARYTAQVLARAQDTKQTLVWGTVDERLHSGTFVYTSTVEFTLPPIGRYQLLGVVLLEHGPVVSAQQGPVLTIVP